MMTTLIYVEPNLVRIPFNLCLVYTLTNLKFFQKLPISQWTLSFLRGRLERQSL